MNFKDTTNYYINEYSNFKNNWGNKDDAIFKYYNILKNINSFDFETATNLLEPGCQSCPLSSFIASKYNFKNAHLFDYSVVNGKNIHKIQ